MWGRCLRKRLDSWWDGSAEKALVSKPDDLSLLSRTQVKRNERSHSTELTSDLRTYAVEPVPPHINPHTIVNTMFKLRKKNLSAGHAILVLRSLRSGESQVGSWFELHKQGPVSKIKVKLRTRCVYGSVVDPIVMNAFLNMRMPF